MHLFVQEKLVMMASRSGRLTLYNSRTGLRQKRTQLNIGDSLATSAVLAGCRLFLSTGQGIAGFEAQEG